ncbi:MAG TPA: DUF4157 domain-containing protein, partial [Rhodanobacteraceae bacterium]|nr:DUF4157 domain-containing protein [Rhodanobacteraceae bacterium]
MGNEALFERRLEPADPALTHASEAHDAPAPFALDGMRVAAGAPLGANDDPRPGSSARSTTVLLKRVQRSHGNRHVQRMLAPNAERHRVVMRSCSCGTCEQCRASAPSEAQPPAAEPIRAIVQAQRDDDGDAADIDADEIVPSSSSGVPLDPQVRSAMASRFDRGFDDVRVHTDAPAAAAAQALGAEAFTAGRDIYFAAGRYAPDTHDGKHLLAHELAHTVQQADGAMPTEIAAKGRDGTLVGGADDPLEAEADRAADAVTREDRAAPALSGDRGGALRAEFSLKDTRLGRALGAAGDAAGNAWNRGKATAGKAWGATKQFVVDQIEKLAPGVLAFLRNLKTWLSDKIGAGFDGLFSGLAGRVRSDGIAGAIEFLVVDLGGGALKGLGQFVAGACSALGDGANFLIDLAKKIGGAAIERIRQDAAAIGAFFSGLWTKFGAPALEALKGFAKSVWDSIAKTLSDIWDRLEPIRKAAKEAWDFVVGAYFEGKGMFDAFLDKLYLKAAEKWEDL